MTIDDEAMARALTRFRARFGKNASVPDATNSSKARRTLWASLFANAKEEIAKERARQAMVHSPHNRLLAYDVLTVRENGQEKQSVLTSRQLDQLIHESGMSDEFSRIDIDATIAQEGSIIWLSSKSGSKVHLEIKRHKRSLIGHFRLLLRAVANYTRSSRQ